jgi:hypothetical protein
MFDFLKSKEQKEKELAKKEEEKKELSKIEQEKNIKQKQKNLIVSAISEGKLPITMENSTGLLLKKDETINLVLTGVNFLEPRAVRYTQGGGAGASYRVSKKVTLRTGGLAAKSRSVDEIKKIDTGTLTITNKKIVFSGSIKTITIDLRKLVDLTPYTDGVATRRENKQKTEYFTNTHKTTLNIKISDNTYNISVDGPVLQAIIQNNINKL